MDELAFQIYMVGRSYVEVEANAISALRTVAGSLLRIGKRHRRRQRMARKKRRGWA